MAKQPVPKRYTSADSKELEIDIRTQEPIFKKVTEIFAQDGVTIAVHDNRTHVPLNSLVIKDDPAGTLAPPAGTTLLFRGQASFGPVAAFRKVPGAAPAPPQASSPAPTGGGAGSKPATPSPPAGDENNTGPEGNPNLNPDGTPKKPGGG